ncbi:peptide chain release factor N(5)-glutamine methyltransferase [Acetobacterium woodii]|uniref:Release factor glutamine methyltransferase n=1 Tax=Acetobacterium woodii (strain ATCC 29683 / DSM 1030 / JCM 2381 / KCTC 1655 / WB1) TaxID=931626 RepID=H6LEI8_ACEWD|nr:peptide chain release factor N(5)-glutamine methyltransferase [Acetobacterium woodii]AFA48091.1 methyltransferase [Acetobacterium woodii DSM 1030]
MTIREILDYGRKLLSQAQIEYPGLEAEILLSGILNKDRVYFYTHHQELLDAISEEHYRQAIKRRSQLEPVAYILGKKEFMGLDFLVNRQVLIPRPDTEPMVEYLIEYLQANFPDGAKILDLCTGSGAIGISIKHFYQKGQVALSDLSEAALTVARENANRLVNGDLSLYQGDLLAALPQGETFTVIVSNPPYIRQSEMKQLAPDIIAYEPHLALDGGESGLDFYRRIIREAPLFLKKNGLLALEVGDEQADAVAALLDRQGYHEIKKIMDLGGHVRCLTGKFTKTKPMDNNKLG